MICRVISTILVMFLLQGCIGTRYKPLAQEHGGAINQLDLYNLVIQDEVRPRINTSKVSVVLGGGMLPALVDASINKSRATKAQDTYVKLYGVTDDLDYRKIFAESLNPALLREFRLKEVKNFAEAITLSDLELKQKVYSLSRGEAFLYLSSSYRITNDSKSFRSTTIAKLYLPRKMPRKITTKPLRVDYSNSFDYESKWVGDGGEKSLGEWAKSQGELFRLAVHESIVEITGMIASDLQPKGAVDCAKRVRFFMSIPTGRKTVSGTLVNKHDGRARVRADNGFLYSTVAPLTESIATVKKSETSKRCEG